MRGINRKSSPQVVKGEVRKKNNWKPSENRYNAPRPHEIVIDRERPGDGYKHILTKKDIYEFISLLPDWNNLAVGLNAIVLSHGSRKKFGYHVSGVVHVCAWDSTMWTTFSASCYERDKAILSRLGVDCEPMQVYVSAQEELECDADELWDAFMWNGQEAVLCKFTEGQARAFQLLDVLLHELGHHHDRMTTRSQKNVGKGEPYAEAYARQYEALIREQYVKTFPLF